MKKYRIYSDIRRDLEAGHLTCLQLTQKYLSAIHSHSHLNLFLEVFEEEVISQAQLIDQKIKERRAGKLAGLVIGIKDVLCYKDHSLTASSHILSNFSSLFTATAVERLLEEDAIIIGRLNCDEFAMGSSNENSYFGPSKNPIDDSRVPGGSSGASAAAVAAHMCHAALGSDTGGSVRQPASFCGVVGFKPTYGRISRWGLIAYASSFDQIGTLTQSVEDAALLLQIMAGEDGKDNTASTKATDNYSQYIPLPSTAKDRDHPAFPTRKVGYFPSIMENEAVDEEIRLHTKESLSQLEDAGHQLVPLDFSYFDYLVPCYYILTTAEASSNLSRFDGIRYGYRTETGEDLTQIYTKSRTEGFGTEVKRRIILGTFVLSAGFFDAYYTQATKVRRLVKNATLKMFEKCDTILTPTSPSIAFKLGEKKDDPVQMYLSDIFTVHANLAGCPAMSIPYGTHSSGLPVGIQLMGRPFEEALLLGMGKELLR